MVKRIVLATLIVAVWLNLSSCGVNVVIEKDMAEVNSTQTGTEEISTANKPTDEIVVTGKDEKVTLRVVDWSDSTKTRREVYNKEFMEKNPNVTVEYTTLTADQFKETVVSAIKAGNAPDLFPIPSGMKLSLAVEENWYQPIDNYVSDEFLESFIPGSFKEGASTLNGEVYLVPEADNIVNTLMYYNKTVLRQSGISEEELPKTFSELKEVCKQVTKAGKGKFYGIIESGAQANRMELELRSFASLGGGKCGDISQILMVDGKNTMDSQAMQNAFGLYDDLAREGVFHPDSTLLKAPESRALFAQNQAAFIIQGSWCISTWRTENPSLEFGVMPLPVPDGGGQGKIPYTGAQPWMGISSNSKHPDIAALYLEGLYSEEYQSGLVSDGGFVSAIKGVNETYMTDEVMKEYYRIHTIQSALAPDPISGNLETAKVYAQASFVAPGLGEIAQGVLAQSVDYKKELKSLADKTQKEWENAIDTVSKRGAPVSKSDFEFNNWDPSLDYDTKLYQSRE